MRSLYYFRSRAKGRRCPPPPTGILSYGWMPGPHPAEEPRDDAALVQSLRDLGQGAADAPDTVLPLDDADEPPQTAMPPAAGGRPTFPPHRRRTLPRNTRGATPARDASSGWSADAQATRRLMVSPRARARPVRHGARVRLRLFRAAGPRRGAAGLRGQRDADAGGRGTRRLRQRAKQALGLVGTAHADDPRCKRRGRPSASTNRHKRSGARRLQEAARRASLALGFHAPARPEPEPAAADDTVHIVGAVTPPPAAAAQPGACNPALVALALCQPVNTARSGYAP